MGRDQRKGRDLRRDEAKLDAEVLAAIRRFVRKQRRKGVRVQYLNFLWDGERYPYLATEYGCGMSGPPTLPSQVPPENDTTEEAVSGIFPVVPVVQPAPVVQNIYTSGVFIQKV